jgi:hypothetical protein
MPSSWLSHVPVCDPFVFRAALICEDCAAKTIGKLDSDKIEDTGSSDEYPQGPYSNDETDSPSHCDNGGHCVNAIKVPGGKKIGCPLSCSLTQHGVESTRRSIAEHIIFGSPHQKAVGRLWCNLYRESLGGPLLKLTDSPLTTTNDVSKALKSLTKNHHHRVLQEMFTDLDCIYGGAIELTGNGALLLWKLELSDEGKPEKLASICLPITEREERSIEDIISEAVSDDAWV